MQARRLVLFLALPCSLLFTGCQSAPLRASRGHDTSVLAEVAPQARAAGDQAWAMPRHAVALRDVLGVPVPDSQSAGRLRRMPAQAWGWETAATGPAILRVSHEVAHQSRRTEGLSSTWARVLSPADDAPPPPPPAPVDGPALPALPPASAGTTALPLDAGLGEDTHLGRGVTVPSRKRRGIGGSRLRANIAVRAPDAVDVGLFFAVSRRLTVGVLGQRLEQDRTVTGGGQLVDPADLNSFISEFTIREETTSFSFGPFVQFQIFAERGWFPEVSVGAFALEWGSVTSASTQYSQPGLIVRKEEDAVSTGEDADTYRSVYFSASKRIPLPFRSPFLRGLRAYGGAGYGRRTGQRYTTALTGAGDPRIRVIREDITRHSFVGWAGAELALPKSLALYGEVFTGDECEAGLAAGLRWNSPWGISFTLGISNCFRSIPQRALDLVYLPGGVGGQPSVITGGSGLSGGGLGYLSPLEDEDEDE